MCVVCEYTESTLGHPLSSLDYNLVWGSRSSVCAVGTLQVVFVHS